MFLDVVDISFNVCTVYEKWQIWCVIVCFELFWQVYVILIAGFQQWSDACVFYAEESLIFVISRQDVSDVCVWSFSVIYLQWSMFQFKLTHHVGFTCAASEGKRFSHACACVSRTAAQTRRKQCYQRRTAALRHRSAPDWRPAQRFSVLLHYWLKISAKLSSHANVKTFITEY